MASEVTGLDPEDTSAEGDPRAYIIFYADGTKAGVINPEDEYWSTRYIGSLIYGGEPSEEGLDGITTADGFIKWNGTTSGFQMQYFLRDHLGSVRVIAEDRNTVISRSDYLPFGTRMSGNGLDEGNGRSSYFGFSGKENELWDDNEMWSSIDDIAPHWQKGERYQHFGARAYDPVSCIFMQTDPLAEKYYSLTPYAYCAGNPVRFYDLDGEDPIDKAVGLVIGAVSNVIPIPGMRDAYAPNDKSDYNAGLKIADDVSTVVAAGLITGGTAAMIVGDEGTVAGLVLCASGVGAMEGAAVAGASVAVSAVGETATVGGAALMASTAINSEGGYNRGGEKVSGKNERHGDGGRALTKADKHIKELEQKMDGASKKVKKELAQKIKNINEYGNKNRKGEEHSRANKR